MDTSGIKASMLHIGFWCLFYNARLAEVPEPGPLACHIRCSNIATVFTL